MPDAPDVIPVARVNRVDRVDRVTSRIAAAGTLAIAVWCIYTCIDRSGMRSAYFSYFRTSKVFVFPTRDVAEWTATIALEALVAAWLLWRARSLPVTCGVLALVGVPAVLVFGAFAMHAPPYYTAHLMFLVFAVAWFVVVGVASWLVRRAKRRAAC
jgi:hypothetical protein